MFAPAGGDDMSAFSQDPFLACISFTERVVNLNGGTSEPSTVFFNGNSRRTASHQHHEQHTSSTYVVVEFTLNEIGHLSAYLRKRFEIGFRISVDLTLKDTTWLLAGGLETHEASLLESKQLWATRMTPEPCYIYIYSYTYRLIHVYISIHISLTFGLMPVCNTLSL